VILRSIRISGWRCFSEPVEISGFTDNLNVIYAPNGTGKSTLIEALTLGMFDNHRVTGTDIKAIKPWGRMLSPSVAIEYNNKGVNYRISKTFLDGAKSLLERMDGGHYTPVAENNHADTMVRAMLTRAVPPRGLSKSEHRGLAQILWAPQGDLNLIKLSGDVIADIRAVLGIQVSSSVTNPIEQKIEALWGQYFTGTGKLKSGREAPEIIRIREKLQEASSELTRAREQQLLFDEASRRVEDLRARQRQSSSFAAGIAEEIGKAEVKVKAYEKLDAERKQKAEQKKAAEAQYAALKQRIDAIAEARKSEADYRQLLDTLEKELPVRSEHLRKLVLEEEKSRRIVENLRRERAAIEAADALWQEAAFFNDTDKKVKELRSLLGNIVQAQSDLENHQKARAGIIAPDKETLRAIGRAIMDRDKSRVHIDAASITLEIVPERDIRVEIISGDVPGAELMQAGQPAQYKGCPEVIIDLKSMARIRARGPKASIEQYRQSLSETEQRLKILTAPYGTTDIDVLNDLNKQAEAIDRKIKEADIRLETLLAGSMRESIEQELHRTEAALSVLLGKHPEWEKEKPDIYALKKELQQTNDAFANAVSAAEHNYSNARQARSKAEDASDQASEKMTELRSRLAGIHKQLTDLTADGKTDEARFAEMNEASMTWNACKIGLEESEKQLSDIGDNPAAVLEKLEIQLNEARVEATNTRDAVQRAEARLQMLSDHGTYTMLSLAEEKVEQLKRDIAAEELRLSAVQLMHSLLAERRNEIMAGITGPVELSASRILKRIAGNRLGQVKINTEFCLQGIIPDDTTGEVAVTNASGGEQEQLHFATRLALAEVVAGAERNLIVLDDVLMATDAGRLARIMTVIEETAQRMQVLILTCHPERYSSLIGANIINLESLIRK